MSFYAKGKGSLTLKSDTPEELGQRLKKERTGTGKGMDIAAAVCRLLYPECIAITPKGDVFCAGKFAYARWDESLFERDLETVADVCVDGEIEFVGEDGTNWKYTFAGGRWHVQEGHVQYRPLGEKGRTKEAGHREENAENFCGTINMGKTCDFTDPCYDKDVWCRKTVSILPGTYNCYAEIEEGHVRKSWIIHEDYDIPEEELHRPNGLIADTEVLPGCGVDSGLFGYFSEKPDYDDIEWQKLCLTFDDINVWENGFFTESGGSDGAYCPVLWKNRKGQVIGAGTVFA